jgi:membrane dipeptidase
MLAATLPIQVGNLSMQAKASQQVVNSAPAVYRSTTVIDGLVVAPASGRVVKELLASGISACNWTVTSHRDETLVAINKIIQFYWLLEQFPDVTLLVEHASDLDRAKREGKLGIILGFQGGSPLGHNVHLVRVFHRLGVRIIQLTYNEANALGAGALESSDSGLTSLGVQAVQEMNRIGVVIDLSHVGRRATLQAIEISTDPVIFSHSNPRTLQENPRNISDEQIRRCAAKGGVVGLATFSAFVGDTYGGKHPGLDAYFRQMDHVLNLVGPDHVAIGTDIFLDPTDGVWWRAVTGRLYPDVSQGMTYETHNIEGFMHQSDFPSVAAAMLERGYDEQTVRKILGDNWRRVFAQVWKAPATGTGSI